MTDDDTFYQGPLGEMAQAQAGSAGMDPADLYLAAISWWSAAVAPAVSVSSWPDAPVTVWTSLVRSDVREGDSLHHLLHRLLNGPGPLAVHNDVTDRKLLSAASHSTRRAGNAGAGTPTFLLTGSPFTSGRGGSRISTSLEGHIRQAWDGRHTLPTRGIGRYRAARRPNPPHFGSLWDLSASEWRGFLSTDAATYSRVLHFARRPAPALRADSTSGSWRHKLATAYGWAFNTRPILTYTTRAVQQWHTIREAERSWDATLPEQYADFFVRIGDHVSRIAGTLAATERTAIHSIHIEAAWSLARRAVLDTARLAAMDRSTVEPVVKHLDDRLFEMSAPEGEASPIRSNAPESEQWQPLGRGTHRNRPQTGSSAVRKLKQWYQDRCQMCAEVLVLPSPRHRYSEAAHIRAREDNGPDIVENLLCLCPTCHVLFDAGARVLADDLTIVDTVTGQSGKRIELHRWHFIDSRYVRHHRQRWAGNDVRLLASAPSAQPKL
ncbi:HNH endonuclease [Streptomyces sp. NBC_01255]|uniref:HNH endonuclease n=1 Tax=Streptomyces sp. NBC_01255 TaxID=2903798 RepID=UPI002E30CC6C|nr:HNH endonuclease [Streptomyces sp. NBC_01255]